MIERDEIEAKADELGLHWSTVQRDYVFGWLIGGLFEVSALREVIALKGGQALRKAYFPATRFRMTLILRRRKASTLKHC